MSGGYTGSGLRHELAGAVHRGEFVVNAPTVQRVGVANLEAMQAGGSVARGGAAPNVVVGNFFDQSAFRSFLQSRQFDDAVIRVVRVQRFAMGI
jgi:hypothetical protein